MQQNKRLTTAALIAAITAARGNAEALDGEYIGTEHLLFALLEGENTTAREVLRRHGADVAALKTAVEELRPPPAAPWGTTRRRSGVIPAESEIPYTSKAHAAYGEAIASGADFGGVIGTGQLLLALLDSRHVAGAVLSQAGINGEVARKVLRELYELDEDSFRADNWVRPEGE